MEKNRIPVNRLLSVLLQAEEMRSIGLGLGQRGIELKGIDDILSLFTKDLEKSHPDNQLTVKMLTEKVINLKKTAEQEYRFYRVMLDSLLEDKKKTVMLSSLSVLEVFPQLVRDLSRAQGKQVELMIEGGEIEMDRRILEEIKDPLIHLIRNRVDHGIESSEERLKNKKPICGTIKIILSAKNGDKVELLISDDGRGIDLARGLGLVMVQEKVERLGGNIKVESSLHVGTTFRIELPLSLATFRGILIESEGQQFAVPSMNVERVLRIKKDQIKSVENRETIQFDNRVLSLIALSDLLQLSQNSEISQTSTVPQQTPYLFIVILKFAEQLIACQVGRILSEQDILVKKMGSQLKRVPHIYGATVLGTGKVVPILNVADLVREKFFEPTQKDATKETWSIQNKN